MKVDDQQLLRDAIARNAGAVISVPSGNVYVHHKTRLVAGEEEGFWIQMPPRTRAQMDLLMTNRLSVGVSLTSASRKVIFTTLVQQFRAGMAINEHISVDAVLLAWPAQVEAIQRRGSYRASVRLDADLPVSVWCIDDEAALAEIPEANASREVITRNLSIDGMGLICVVKTDAPAPGVNQRMRISLSHPGGQLLLGGRVRHVRALPNGNASVGIQFDKLESSVENRPTLAALTNLVSQLQRDEIRRHRFGEATARAG
jgi:c-di-GMP-binding flagellar brake protein YcgR